jgi:hypothetical protein
VLESQYVMLHKCSIDILGNITTDARNYNTYISGFLSKSGYVFEGAFFQVNATFFICYKKLSKKTLRMPRKPESGQVIPLKTNPA